MDKVHKVADSLAELMEEFGLDSAKYAEEDFCVEFCRHQKSASIAPMHMLPETTVANSNPPISSKPVNPQVQGTPVSSPMSGIYYSSSSPSAPPFVQEGEPVIAGQVVGLIEAMKVFNELTAPTSGVVTRIVAKNGAMVNPGEPLLYIE